MYAADVKVISYSLRSTHIITLFYSAVDPKSFTYYKERVYSSTFLTKKKNEVQDLIIYAI